MRKFMMFFAIITLFPLLVSGAHVFIWNFDPADRFYDSEIGSTVNCAYWLERVLSAKGHTGNTNSYLPSDLSGYSVVFVTVGWPRG